MKQKIKILSGILILSFFFFSSFARGENLTITTYYPSPYGSYRELTWGCIAQGSVAKLKEWGGGSIDLGGVNCAAPFNTASPELNFINSIADPTNLPRVQLRLNETDTNVLEVNYGILRAGTGSIIAPSATCENYMGNSVFDALCPAGSWAMTCGPGFCDTLGEVWTSRVWDYSFGYTYANIGCPVSGHMICVRHD